MRIKQLTSICKNILRPNYKLSFVKNRKLLQVEKLDNLMEGTFFPEDNAFNFFKTYSTEMWRPENCL